MTASVAELRRPVLRAVSRSFYLSIRLLPRALRDPIALAYLLARATDTIADTAEVEPAVRAQHLQDLASVIAGVGSAGGAAAVRDSFAPLQQNADERRLIESLPACISWLEALAPADRDDIRRVLAKITEGQRSDVRRFESSSAVTALPTAADLDEYTYLVAGCVGEFWTSVCFRHLSNVAALPREQMVSLGVSYGKGLQLINVLRDVGPDLRGGRCYLPADQLRSVGLGPAEILGNAARAEPVLKEWRAKAQQGIADGIEYSCAIRPFRVRLATALPALIGARTLALLEQAGPAFFEQKVKVSRREVRGILVQLVASLASPRSISTMFRQLSSRAA